MTATQTEPVAGSPSGQIAGPPAAQLFGQLRFTAEMAHELAVSQKVCVRPIVRRVIDQATGEESRVALPCNSTQESRCPSCAEKNRRLRMQQCREGWHRTDEPEQAATDGLAAELEDQADDEDRDGDPAADYDHDSAVGVRRSTRRRDDLPDLPRLPREDRTVGRAFCTPDGKTYRPSMFLTLTMPSYGRVKPNGAPLDPGSYDYRRAALDALHFPKLVNRFWEHIRRCAGFNVQYFASVEPQRRLAPHLHAAVRGVIPRAVLRQVVAATYVNVWWPAFERPVYVYRTPEWVGDGYCDLDTGIMLPTWEEAQAAADADPEQRPAHSVTFGSQIDMAGIIAPSPDADRAIRYLTKYLAKSISSTYSHPAPDPDQLDGQADELRDPDEGRVRSNRAARDAEYEAHIDRLHAELRFLPCSERCANWLRYGIQPEGAGPGLRAGHCPSKAHDREHLGLGGRRVLVSQQWSGKTLRQHKADRATVVRETLLSAGIVAPDVERLAASVTMPDGRPRFSWTDTRPDPHTYAAVILETVIEQNRRRAEYDTAKQHRPVDNSYAAGGDADGPDG